MPNDLHFLNPEELAGVADLQLLARIVVEGFLAGLHRSPHFGSAIEFAQYRPYVQGDDLRFVDWNLYARTDRLHTKQFYEETNLRCLLLLDCSASMLYASRGMSKFEYARILAACLAYLLVHQNDAVGLSAFQNDVHLYMPPRNTPRYLRRVLVELANLQPAGETNLPRAIQHACETVPPRGMVVVISDLLSPLDDLISALRRLRARRFDVMVLQVADPAERDFTFDKSISLVDLESSREQFVTPADVRDQYLQNRRAHFDALRAACASVQADYEEFVTNEPLDRALHHFLNQRALTLSAASAKRPMARRGAG
ncbi:MAG: DUF58 domain-containing protein [bacterium]|nr:DUF58 domain-containing protein [bacterium]